VTVGGVDLSDHLTNVETSMSFDDIDSTAFGSTVRQHTAGLGNHTVTLTFQQDYASAKVHRTIWTSVGSTATVVVWPNGTTASSTNPKWTMGAVILDYKPLSASIGDLMTFSVTWPVNSLAEATV
jgi:hypothetical protein